MSWAETKTDAEDRLENVPLEAQKKHCKEPKKEAKAEVKEAEVVKDTEKKS